MCWRARAVVVIVDLVHSSYEKFGACARIYGRLKNFFLGGRKRECVWRNRRIGECVWPKGPLSRSFSNNGEWEREWVFLTTSIESKSSNIGGASLGFLCSSASVRPVKYWFRDFSSSRQIGKLILIIPECICLIELHFDLKLWIERERKKRWREITFCH